ncbi:MAG: Serine phosphatase RsbU, regulator of sigma subunit [Nitrospira sp.]|nr:MAG: Serine phosphatase RsbU, regulator of sigma subunit [Nitrospira sp.]
MRPEEEDRLLGKIAHLLESGLKTQVEPFPETHIEFAKILDELRALPQEDLRAKLVIGGFTNTPYGPDQMRCLECMYYLVHRKWCDLPELAVPVEPDWWCRLWRI